MRSLEDTIDNGVLSSGGGNSQQKKEKTRRVQHLPRTDRRRARKCQLPFSMPKAYFKKPDQEKQCIPLG